MANLESLIRKMFGQGPQREERDGPPTRMRLHNPVNIPPGDKQESDLQSVQYIQTRVTELDPQHLLDNRIVALNKRDPNSYLFDFLRTQVLRKMQANNWRSLAILSPTPGAGKTFVAINLAISIAQHPNKSAILVDMDLRRPQVAYQLGLPSTRSLYDYLEGTASLAQVLVNPGIPRLVIAPVYQPIENSAELLSSKKVHNMITDLRQRYDSRIVILDLPPLLSADDTMIVLPQVDCALMVIGNGKHSESELQDSMRLLNGVNLLGTVINRVDAAPVIEPY